MFNIVYHRTPNAIFSYALFYCTSRKKKGKICFDVCDRVRDRMDKNANRSWELRRAVAL
nr:MAG TPA: hypothetical protein [Microviridae sp.]